jgi:hypothetical protein
LSIALTSLHHLAVPSPSNRVTSRDSSKTETTMTLLFPNNSINALFSLLSLVLDFLHSLSQPSPIPQSLGIILPYPYHLIPLSHILITRLPIMVITGGYTVTPHHRQNRRRERPGSRSRRTITRKASVSMTAQRVFWMLETVVFLSPQTKHVLPLFSVKTSTRVGSAGRRGRQRKKQLQ